MASSTTFTIDSDEHIELLLEYKFDMTNLKTIYLTFKELDPEGDAFKRVTGQLSIGEIKALRNYLNSFLEVCDSRYDSDSVL